MSNVGSVSVSIVKEGRRCSNYVISEYLRIEVTSMATLFLIPTQFFFYFLKLWGVEMMKILHLLKDEPMFFF